MLNFIWFVADFKIQYLEVKCENRFIAGLNIWYDGKAEFLTLEVGDLWSMFFWQTSDDITFIILEDQALFRCDIFSRFGVWKSVRQ